LEGEAVGAELRGVTAEESTAATAATAAVTDRSARTGGGHHSGRSSLPGGWRRALMGKAGLREEWYIEEYRKGRRGRRFATRRGSRRDEDSEGILDWAAKSADDHPVATASPQSHS
jgi:hypothetical protein